ncbi:ATP-binding protein [Corallincola platygyrae]|uniref:histidine kinase n=1 Tax=Corallincola platygyrae TaxID=1193278 RepID=A0ABW4XKF4_9GAMM
MKGNWRNSLLPQKLVPKTMLSRMVIMLLAAILLSQSVVSVIWITQFEHRDEESLIDVSNSLALSMASTVRFFRSLPFEYRHIVLNQLRNMGGTRFFVSLNYELIDVVPLTDSRRKSMVVDEVSRIMKRQFGEEIDVKVEFSAPETLHVLNNETLLTDLPPSWAQHTLVLEPYNPPILVMQFPLEDGEWIYMAALLPEPLMNLETEYLPRSQLVFLVIVTAMLLISIMVVVKWLSAPLKRFSTAAKQLGQDIHRPPLEVSGPAEIAEAAKAMNAMQEQLKRYLDDREELFSAISHDLKTPITRLRLRAELLDDDEHSEKFIKNLDELELMVKGALQCVKDTDIHENIESVDMMGLLQSIQEELADPETMSISGSVRAPFRGKPLALKRCLTNLIDNAIKYGDRVKVTLLDYEQRLYVLFRDYGPGISLYDQKKIFEPYVRLDNTRNRNASGSGLGMGIARNIVRAHGGNLDLMNHPQGGLLVKLTLPRQ